MIGAYIYTPAIWPPLAAAVLLAALGVYSLRHREVPGALPFAMAWLACAPWLAGVAAESAATGLAAKSAWHTFQALWQLPIATAMACFALEYVFPGRWLTRRNLVLLAVPLLAATALLATNDLHRFIWRGLIADGLVRPESAAGGWILIGYAAILALVQVAAFAWLFARSPRHRWPAAMMLTVAIATRGVWLVDVLHHNPLASLDAAILPPLLAAAIYAIALFGFRIFDPLAAARATALEQMREGMVVLDARSRVASLNPAAATILGADTARARGRTLQELLPAVEDLSAHVAHASAGARPVEISLGAGSEARRYALNASVLTDFRGWRTGYLLLLRDVTEQRRAQAQIVEQQRSLAALREREWLARELHDSIGQVLAYANVQVEAANLLIDGGRATEARTQLSRLGSVLRDAHAEVRQQIQNLRAAPSPQRPLFAAFRHYLDAFTSHYGIETELAVEEGLGEEAFPPRVQAQLHRILQEALSNARKHSAACRVQVALEGTDGAVRMSILDDGCGFDLGRATDAAGGHLGLDFMRQRAEELGGSVRIESAPGEGTRLVVEVPVGR